jgi:uncharacterized protein (TIGR00299 family) protein
VTICYVDAFSGLAGDMLLGALADAGADRDAISEKLNSLGLDATVSWEKVLRGGITATKFRVTAPETQKHRHLSHILRIVEGIPNAEKVFRVLAEAEAAVHGVSIEKVHFHEVGAVDSICDIAGICVALDLLGVDRICCSPINVGSGTVKTEHGILPVPAPATARLLQNKPIYSRGPALELTTPTGAAIVAALADSFGTMPALTIQAIGYGAGDHDFKEHANVVRVILGQLSGAAESTTVSIIEANIDDASPQVIAWAAERLLDAGALDALVIPALMKKGRPGVIMQVIAAPEKREEMIAILFRETTTLGLRFYEAQRRVQPRELIPVETAHGTVRIKASPQGFAPEYEDARRIADDTGVPLKQILADAASTYLRK